MSITVEDLLEISSLRNTKVLAGRKGLTHIVSRVSVLEYVEPSSLQSEMLPNNVFYGSELVITAFAHIKDDVEAQLANISRLADAGVVGLILFYVGVLMPRVDRRLIALADEREIPLICMPERRMDLRYSEVIYEVMETIFRDQDKNKNFISDVLNRVTRLPAHQHTVDTVLKMICDRICTSMILTDASGRTLNVASWPRSEMGELISALPSLTLPLPEEAPVYTTILGGCYIHCCRIVADNSQSMYLLLFYKEQDADSVLLRQITEVVQLAVNIWSRQHDEVAITELVRAIFLSETLKIHRLAELFRIDVEAIRSIWILHCEDFEEKADLHKVFDVIQYLPDGFAHTVMMDIYQEDLVLFLDEFDSLRDQELFYEELCHILEGHNVSPIITQCNGLLSMSQVREAFLDNQTALSDTMKIFPGLMRYTIGQVRFAKFCKDMIGQGERKVSEELYCLHFLQEAREGEELLRTLAVYLLDCQFSVSKTAQALFLHKNTIKYRIQKISDLLGYPVNQMPESIYLYRAVAIRRLLF